MTETKGIVVFDVVVGTLIGHECLFVATQERMGGKLRAEGIKPVLLCQMWLETAEREYTHLSMSGKYVGFAQVLQAIFFRMLLKAGIPEPRDFASLSDVEFIMDKGYTKLEMRPGARECIERLREAGFTVWALTAADRLGCAAYFKHAAIDFPVDNLLSCDTFRGAFCTVFERHPWEDIFGEVDVISGSLLGMADAIIAAGPA